MAHCHEMHAGEVYVCENCGLELEVKKSCADEHGAACACVQPVMCCGKPLTKK